MVKESDKMQAYMAKCAEYAQDASDEAYKVVVNIEDMEDEWQQHEEAIESAVQRRADQEGISRQLAYEFNLFNIEDMYNDRRAGTICWTCKKGKACEKHPFGR